MKIIGITGYAGVGKDAAAGFLTREHGFTRIAFADPLREMLYEQNPLVQNGPFGTLRVQQIVDSLGWDKAKREFPEIRALLQNLGGAVRTVLGESVWVDNGFLRVRCTSGSVAITDCRYANECQRVLDSGGEVWRIVRPGVGPVNGHSSDAGVPDHLVTRTILNDGSLSDLGYAVFGALTA